MTIKSYDLMVTMNRGDFLPKDTFFNLPDSKRVMIENAAINEFAEYGYENASINRIVEKCNIAKGSYYQYFEDKRDMFLHIMKMIGERKLQYVTPTLQNPQEHDFFTLIREIYMSGLRFATDNIKLANIANQLMKNTNSPIYKDLISENMGSTTEVYENLLRLAQQRGEVRQDIDVKYVGYMMTTMSIANIEYWLCGDGTEFDIKQYMKTVMDTVDMQMDLIKNGIGVK